MFRTRGDFNSNLNFGDLNTAAQWVHRCGRNNLQHMFHNVANCFAKCNHVFMDKKEAQQWAKQIAGDLDGPVGRVPIERLFAKHIVFFEVFRETGATWKQIAALLARAGVTRKDGHIIEASQIRATVSRILASARIKNSTNISLDKEAQLIHEKPANSVKRVVAKSTIGDSQNTSLREKMAQASKART